MIAFGQGYASMNAPTKKLEELVLAGKLAHGGHPVLRWMAGNVSIETDAADNWKSIERIDGITALIMALDLATTRKRAEPFLFVSEHSIRSSAQLSDRETRPPVSVVFKLASAFHAEAS